MKIKERERRTLVVPFFPDIVLSTSRQSTVLPLHLDRVSEDWNHQRHPVSRIRLNTASWLPPSRLLHPHFPRFAVVQSDMLLNEL